MLAASSAEAAMKGAQSPVSWNASSPFSWNEDGVLSLARSGCHRNVGFAAFVQSTVDEPALRKSCESLVERHSQLRTAFIIEGSDSQARPGGDDKVSNGVAAVAAAGAAAGAATAATTTTTASLGDGIARLIASVSDVKLDFEMIYGGGRQMQEAQRALVEPFDLAAPLRAGASLLRVRLISAQEAEGPSASFTGSSSNRHGSRP